MKSVEELDYLYGWSDEDIYYEGYSDGKEEQKALDAIELPQRFRKVLNKQKQDLIDKAWKWITEEFPNMYFYEEDFRKAMEE